MEGECSADPPSVATPCQVYFPEISFDVLTMQVRCERIPSLPPIAGREADVGLATDPALAVPIRVERCPYN